MRVESGGQGKVNRGTHCQNGYMAKVGYKTEGSLTMASD